MPYSTPPTLLINLNHRIDRLSEINHEFRDWCSLIERIPAVRISPGWKGCAASHLKCIRLAKQRGYPWVLILEDDCMLNPGAKQRFQELLPLLWKTRSQWDIFYGGATFLTDYKQKEKDLFEIKGLTTHFCLVHKDTYNLILEKYPQDVSPIDIFYKTHLRIWTSAPFIAIQRPSNSDNTDVIDPSSKNDSNIADYKDFFKKAETKLLTLPRDI